MEEELTTRNVSISWYKSITVENYYPFDRKGLSTGRNSSLLVKNKVARVITEYSDNNAINVNFNNGNVNNNNKNNNNYVRAFLALLQIVFTLWEK
ncbi:MAG: hypothetical protein KBS42_05130 [Bacteroidales bacterium]|nr:hypothetical protein [Candidatus Colicola coprequi]